MILDILAGGGIVAIGLLITFLKCPWRVRMRMLSNPLKMDIGIFLLLNIIHWGTFTGVMVAAAGAATCSGLLTLGRWLWGSTNGTTYKRGTFNIIDKLNAP